MKEKKKNMMKVKWLILIGITCILYIFAIKTQEWVFNFLVVLLASCIYKYGHPILFKEYNEQRKKNWKLQLRLEKLYKLEA